MKTYKQFLEEAYIIEMSPSDWTDKERNSASGGGGMSDADIDSNPNLTPEQKAKLKARRSAKNKTNQSQATQNKSTQSKTYQNIKDTVKNKVKKAASKVYTASPRDAVNAARNAAKNAKTTAQNAAQNVKSTVKNAASKAYNASPKDYARKAAEVASDIKTKAKYGRTIKPDTTGASSLAKRSSDLAKVSKASKALRIAGRVAGPAAAALDVAAERSKGSGWLRSLAKGAVTAAGGAAGGAAGSVVGPVGTVAGAAGGATAASKAFDIAAGKNAKERAADRMKNRQRQAGGALVGTGGKTTFDTKKNTITTGGKTAQLGKTSVVKDPKSGKQETGYLAYKGGKAVYKRADKPGTGSSNAFERIGRTINPNAYKANDAKLAAQKLNKAKQSDAARNKALGVKPK